MYWSWPKSAAALAACFLLSIVLVKPIGVSTQFVIFDGILASLVDDNMVVADQTAKSGYSSPNAYLNRSAGKYAKAVVQPLNYGFIFVLSMVLGGFIGVRTQSKRAPQLPRFHSHRFGERPGLRYLLAFAGGILVLFGARLAGGCTSGHMMSGMMQTAVSGYIFALSAFVAAVPTAIFMYHK